MKYGFNRAKNIYTFGTLPIMTLPGQNQLTVGNQMNQSNAIARYIAQAYKGKNGEVMYPGNSNPDHSYQIDLLLEESADSLGKFFFLT